jgi:hypothetical protein
MVRKAKKSNKKIKDFSKKKKIYKIFEKIDINKINVNLKNNKKEKKL